MAQAMTQHPNITTAADESIWSRSQRWLTLGLILTITGAAFETLAVATTLPATVQDLGGLSLYGWAFSAFMLTNLIGITIAGAEADRNGPARPFVAGVALFVLGLVFAGLAGSMMAVVLGRAVQGFGAGTISSVAYAAIGRGYGEAARPRMLAVLSSAWVVPGLVGPALAGVIADHLGWRWVFLGLVPLPLIAAGMALPALRRFDRASTAPRDWGQALAAVRLAAGAGLVLAGLGAATLPLAGAMLVVGGALGLPALRQLLPAGTLRAAPGLPAAVATMGLLNLAFFGVDAFLPLALMVGRGQSAMFAGTALTLGTIFWTTGAWIQAHMAQRQDRRWLVIGGLALIVLAIAGLIGALLPAMPAVLALLAWSVGGLGMGLAFSTTSLVVLESAPEGEEGAASAALQLANVLGVAFGAGIGGVFIGMLGDDAAAVRAGVTGQSLLMIVVAGVAITAATRLARRREEAA